jgi:tetratricopeptide (TPR) repeat protein
MQRRQDSANHNQEIIRVKMLEMSNKLGRNENAAAIADANDVINTYPEVHYGDVVQFAYRIRASARIRIGDFLAALVDADKALSLDKKDIFSYQSRAAAKFAMGDYYGAIADASWALEIHQDYSSAYVTRAQAKLRVGVSSFREDAEKAIRITTSNLGDNASGEDRRYRQAFLLRERATAKRVINDVTGAVADETRAAQLTSLVAYIQQQGLFASQATVNAPDAEAKERQRLLDDLTRSEVELALLTSCVPGK